MSNVEWNTNEELVTVNQRHLIDKILARYSTEFTIFRELLQNSNDAGASECEIHFLSSSNTGQADRIVYKNNGRVFLKEDWFRLRKIAEGNPDENKIGMFGVGFYSLFSVCEQPMITSGLELMGFLWKGDQLYTKRGSRITGDEWTTFDLSLREPMDYPEIYSFGKFITTSLAFTKNIRLVSVYHNDKKILSFNKKVADPRPISFGKSSFNLYSPNNLFYLRQVVVNPIQLDVCISINQESQDFNLFMRTATADFDVKLSSNLIKEMERTTKKKPPTSTQTHILWSSWDEYSSSSGTKGKNSMFDDLVPSVGDQGRVFIGFPTHQTTGSGIHLAAHLIPTVERESIDFVDKSLNVWNQELLSTAGLLCRIIYNDEFESIHKMYEEMPKPLSPEVLKWLIDRANHCMNSLTFKATTPSNIVGRIIGSYFSKSCKLPLVIMSSKGVLGVDKVRILNKPIDFGIVGSFLNAGTGNEMDGYLKGFIKNVAIVPDEVISYCPTLISQLTSSNQLQPIAFTDVLFELKSRSLTNPEIISCIKWFLAYRQVTQISYMDLNSFMQGLIITFPEDNNRKISLNAIHYFINPKIITPGVPLPNDTLPLEISKAFNKSELETVFGDQLKVLSLSTYAHYISSNSLLTTSPEFSEKILGIFSRAWNNTSQSEKAIILSIFSPMDIIPTRKHGMKRAEDAYFKNVNLFDDLPVVFFPSQHQEKVDKGKSDGLISGLFSAAVSAVSGSKSSVSEVFLRALGVREHVDLQMIFDRLDNLNWDHIHLVKYLTSVQAKLSTVEYERLRVTPLYPTEENDEKRYRAFELYTPTEELRGLGVNVLKWKGRWHKSSEEAKFLASLGLKDSVSLNDLLTMINKAPTTEIRTKYLMYFFDNHKTIYSQIYKPLSTSIPFIPCIASGKEAILSTPSDCFTDTTCLILNLKVIAPEFKNYSNILGVAQNPPVGLLVDFLRTTPPTIKDAGLIFGYFASRGNEFSKQDWIVLKSLKFIPIIRDEKNGGKVVWVEPSNVYFSGNESPFRDQFDFIDFGVSGNTFLRSCGVKDEPSTIQIAIQLIQTPNEFLAKGLESYLAILRQLSVNFASLQQNRSLINQMKKSSFLVGLRNDLNVEGSGSDKSLQFQLAKASEIYLIDDTVLKQIFMPLSCPLESVLEDMYFELGSQWLSKQVKETHIPSGKPQGSEKSQQLEALIHERASLLCYEGVIVRTTQELSPGAEKLLKNIKVFEVPEIKISRVFNRVENLQKAGACLIYDSKSRKNCLLIAGDYDYFDVSMSLCGLILLKNRLNDRLLISTLLSTSLSNLKQKGFPIERVFNLQASHRLREAQEVKKNERYRAESEQRSLHSHQAPSSQPPSYDDTFSTNKKFPLEERQLLQSLCTMFPNISPEVIKSLIVKHTNNPDAITAVTNELLDYKAPPQKEIDHIRGNSSASSPVDNDSPVQDNNYGGMLNKFTERLQKSGWGEKLLGAISTTSNNSSPPSSRQREESIRAPVSKITPDFTNNLEQQLKNSLTSLKTTTEESIRAQIPNDPPVIPSLEASSRCHLISDSDLKYVTTLGSMRVYVDKKAFPNETEAVLNGQGLPSFVNVLTLIAGVFDILPSSFHIYWDREGPTVAFNRGRTLFFNLRYFLGLHFANNSSQSVVMPGSFESSEAQSSSPNIDCNVYFYWFLTTSHELSHNFVGDHNAEHEFYMSAFNEVYLKKLVRTMLERGITV